MWLYVGQYLTIPFMPLLPPRPALLAVVLCATAGCGNPLARKLEGRWLGAGVESFEQRDLAAATGWAKGVLFEFSGQKVTVAIPAEEPRSAPYRIAAVHGSRVDLSVERPDGKLDPLSLVLDDERSLRWMIDSSHAVVLTRE